MVCINQIRIDPILGPYVVLSIFDGMVFGYYLRTSHPSCYKEEIVLKWKIREWEIL
jgi:hypothetical protein